MLTLMVGPSGAGKTTYVQTWYRPSLVLNPDDIRIDMNLKEDDDLEPVFKALHGLLGMRILHKLPTVIDACNLQRHTRIGYAKLVPEVTYVVIDRDLTFKLQDKGDRSVKRIVTQHLKFNNTLDQILRGDGLHHVTVLDRRNFNGYV